MSDQKREETEKGKYSIHEDESGASIPSLTRLLNRKSFKRDAPSAPATPSAIDASPLPKVAPPSAALAPVIELRVRPGRRNPAIAQIHEAAPPERVTSWDPTHVMQSPSARQLPWLRHFAEVWKKSAPEFGGAILAVFRATQGDQWQPMLLLGEPPARLIEKGTPLEGLQWSEALTPDTFRLWRQHPGEAIDFEESSVAVTERSAVFAALGLLNGERVSLLPARTAHPTELCIVISTGRLPHELLAAVTSEPVRTTGEPPMAKAA